MNARDLVPTLFTCIPRRHTSKENLSFNIGSCDQPSYMFLFNVNWMIVCEEIQFHNGIGTLNLISKWVMFLAFQTRDYINKFYLMWHSRSDSTLSYFTCFLGLCSNRIENQSLLVSWSRVLSCNQEMLLPHVKSDGNIFNKNSDRVRRDSNHTFYKHLFPGSLSLKLVAFICNFSEICNLILLILCTLFALRVWWTTTTKDSHGFPGTTFKCSKIPFLDCLPSRVHTHVITFVMASWIRERCYQLFVNRIYRPWSTYSVI